MKLVAEWRRVLRHAWSIRLIAAAGVLTGCEIALPIIDQIISIPRGLFAALPGLVTCGALISRLIAQEKLKGDDDGE